MQCRQLGASFDFPKAGLSHSVDTQLFLAGSSRGAQALNFFDQNKGAQTLNLLETGSRELRHSTCWRPEPRTGVQTRGAQTLNFFDIFGRSSDTQLFLAGSSRGAQTLNFFDQNKGAQTLNLLETGAQDRSPDKGSSDTQLFRHFWPELRHSTFLEQGAQTLNLLETGAQDRSPDEKGDGARTLNFFDIFGRT